MAKQTSGQVVERGAIVVRRRVKIKPTCGECHREESTALCDYPLDNNFATYTTCSKPVCDKCKTRRGTLDFCRTHST